MKTYVFIFPGFQRTKQPYFYSLFMKQHMFISIYLQLNLTILLLEGQNSLI